MPTQQNNSANMLANQEQQNAQTLQAMAQKEAQAAAQLRTGNAAGAGTLAQQEVLPGGPPGFR
jgi:hypothetical protein